MNLQLAFAILTLGYCIGVISALVIMGTIRDD